MTDHKPRYVVDEGGGPRELSAAESLAYRRVLAWSAWCFAGLASMRPGRSRRERELQRECNALDAELSKLVGAEESDRLVEWVESHFTQIKVDAMDGGLRSPEGPEGQRCGAGGQSTVDRIDAKPMDRSVERRRIPAGQSESGMLRATPGAHSEESEPPRHGLDFVAGSPLSDSAGSDDQPPVAGSGACPAPQRATRTAALQPIPHERAEPTKREAAKGNDSPDAEAATATTGERPQAASAEVKPSARRSLPASERGRKSRIQVAGSLAPSRRRLPGIQTLT